MTTKRSDKSKAKTFEAAIADLPAWITNLEAAELISTHLFRISPLTIRHWTDVEKKFVQRRVLRSKAGVIAKALAMLEDAPEAGPKPNIKP